MRTAQPPDARLQGQAQSPPTDATSLRTSRPSSPSRDASCSPQTSLPTADYLPVLLDAMVLGRVHKDKAHELASCLTPKVRTAQATAAAVKESHYRKPTLLEGTISTLEIARWCSR